MSARTLADALEDFPEEIMGVVIIGKTASTRVWLDDRITTRDQFDWAASRTEQGATLIRTMEPGTGTA